MFYYEVPTIQIGQRYAAVHCVIQERFLLIKVPKGMARSRVKSYSLREARRYFSVSE
jgi:hypothetical protein